MKHVKLISFLTLLSLSLTTFSSLKATGNNRRRIRTNYTNADTNYNGHPGFMLPYGVGGNDFAWDLNLEEKFKEVDGLIGSLKDAEDKLAQGASNMDAEAKKMLEMKIKILKSTIDEEYKFLSNYSTARKNRAAQESGKNGLIYMMTDSNDDTIDTLMRIDYSRLGPKDYASAVASGIAIQAASSLGRRVGKAVDENVGRMVSPVVNGIANFGLGTYRLLFKGGNVPFSKNEIALWQSVVDNSLRFLQETGKGIAEFIDRDHQQRRRDLLRNYTSDDATNGAMQEAPTTEQPEAATPVQQFAQTAIYNSVIQPLDDVAQYILRRQKYYSATHDRSTYDGQILNMSDTVYHAINTIKQEIEMQESLDGLTKPEFKAVIPHYIKYVSACFDNLGQMVDSSSTFEKKTSKGTSSGWGSSNRSKKKNSGFGGFLD